MPIEHIIIREGSRIPRTRRHRIPVFLLGSMIDDPKWPIERICEQYDLTAGEVYAAWSYYSDHKEEIDRAVAEGDERVRQMAHEVVFKDLP